MTLTILKTVFASETIRCITQALFYIQEPSASYAVSAIGISAGDRVLDLCAAPGGKSTQAAAALNNTGFILSNEYVQSRVRPLASNIERMGIANSVVTSMRP